MQNCAIQKSNECQTLEHHISSLEADLKKRDAVLQSCFARETLYTEMMDRLIKGLRSDDV